MLKPERILRKYTASDADMLAFARLVHTRFSSDLGAFTAFNTDMTAAYASDFLAAIDAAEAMPADVQKVAQMAQKTADVMQQMQAGRQYFQTLKYFVGLAFENRLGVWEEFHFGTYDEVRQNQTGMIQLLLDLSAPMAKYAADLLAAGMPQSQIDILPIRADGLQAANTAQENAKAERMAATEARVLALNGAWAYVRNIRMAAKLVYFSDYAQWMAFALPWNVASGGLVGDVTVSGVVAFGATRNIAIEGLLPSTVLTITNTGGVPLRFCAGTAAGAACGAVGRVFQVSESVSLSLQDLAAAGVTPTVLNVSHTEAAEPAPAGEYSVIKVA